MEKKGFVYLLTNVNNNVIYAGVTSDLVKRVYEHKNGFVDGFTKKYNAKKLVYYEGFESIVEAIAREKQIKGGSRKKKLKMIESVNPEFKDLYGEIL